MKTAASDESIAATCRHRRAPIGCAPYAREADDYCCEGCFLAEQKQHALAAAIDIASVAPAAKHARNAQSAFQLWSAQ